MTQSSVLASLLDPDEPILVTGAAGFIGTRVVRRLLTSGVRNLRCLVRQPRSAGRLGDIIRAFPMADVEVIEGNLLSRSDCATAAAGVRVIFHLAAGIEKSFAGCFLNSVVATRNLLDAVQPLRDFKRFVNVSSLAVYSNLKLRRRAVLDESCELESDFVARHDPYAFAKLRQDELLMEHSARTGLPYVILRPGAVYGPGKPDLSARVGIDTFGIFLHLGGRNPIPFTHVDNCADAIVLAGTVPGVDGEIFNVVDDDLPSSREFLAHYQREVARVRHISVPYSVFYAFCFLWETYSRRSDGQLPPAFNRRRCSAYWKGNHYSNEKLKSLLGWSPAVPFRQGYATYFEYLRTLRPSSC